MRNILCRIRELRCRRNEMSGNLRQINARMTYETRNKFRTSQQPQEDPVVVSNDKVVLMFFQHINEIMSFEVK